MDQVKKSLNQANTFIEKHLGKIVHNQYVFPVLHLMIILYAAKVAPILPQEILKIFDNFFFKIVFMFLILFTARFEPMTAIFITIAFLITMNYVHHGKLIEFLDNVDNEMASQGAVLQVASNIVETTPESTPESTPETTPETTPEITPESTPTPSGSIFVNELAPETKEPETTLDSGCLPHRKADMSKIIAINNDLDSPFSEVDFS